jgi:histone H4
MSKLVFEDARAAVTTFLTNLIHDAAIYADHGRRYTVTAMDVVLACKRRGRALYGYGDYAPEQIRTKVARLKAPLPAGLVDSFRVGPNKENNPPPQDAPATPVAVESGIATEGEPVPYIANIAITLSLINQTYP